jgi:lysophospholipase L1-like esterase
MTLKKPDILENIEQLDNKIGDLSTLNTSDKASLKGAINEVNSSLADITQVNLPLKVDKVAGKGLSTNDYSNTEKAEVAKVALKANIIDVNTQIASVTSGTPKGVYATLVALQTAFPTGTTGIYVVSSDKSWYFWNGSAWTLGGLYQSTGILPKSIDYLKDTKQIPITFKTTPKNLYDKKTVISGYLDKNNGGALVVNAGYIHSDYIYVKPSTSYVVHNPFQALYFDGGKNFISGVGITTAPFTTPANCVYLVLNNSAGEQTTQMLEEGTTASVYEAYFDELKINANEIVNPSTITETLFDNNLVKKVNRITRISEIINDTLLDITKKTKIKLIGDSITAGEGSTGYAHNGATIPGTSIGMNSGGSCWANFLNTLISNRFNKQIDLSVSNPIIKYYVPYSFNGSYDSSAILTNFFIGGGTRNAIGIDFYGNSISFRYTSSTNAGIVDVYLDGVKQTSLDTYDATYQSKTYSLSGLTVAKHTLEIYETATKNASASDYKFYLEKVTINKVASVINYGLSGYRSDTILNIVSNLIESDDDIVIMQLGTNDRGVNPIADYKRYMRKIFRTALGINPNIKIILMSASPTSATTENQKLYSMYEIDKAIKELALEMNVEYISNYMGFLQYMEYTDASIDSLLADGLHPNDTGHKIMYRNIIKNLGIGYVADGVTI